MTPEQRYEDLVDEFAGVDGVMPPPGGSGFGRGALRFRRKIFAMLVRGQLVLKLPRQRVDELVADGQGERFDANKGTPMKEWFSLDPESELAWPPLAREALDFARGTLSGVTSIRGHRHPASGVAGIRRHHPAEGLPAEDTIRLNSAVASSRDRSSGQAWTWSRAQRAHRSTVT